MGVGNRGRVVRVRSARVEMVFFLGEAIAIGPTDLLQLPKTVRFVCLLLLWANR